MNIRKIISIIIFALALIGICIAILFTVLQDADGNYMNAQGAIVAGISTVIACIGFANEYFALPNESEHQELFDKSQVDIEFDIEN